MQRIGKDSLAGATFIVFGLAFAIAASRYEIGTALRMGPGYFPLVLGGVLVLLGVLSIAKEFTAPDEDAIGGVPWRSVVTILGALLFFGVTIKGLGVIPALFLTAFLAALGGYKVNLPLALATATGLTVLCYLIFILALQLRLDLYGPWVGA